MIINKVEICGVNTSKLPVLKESEKREEGEVTKVTFIGVTDDYEKEVANIPSSIYENYCLSVI